MRRTLPPTSRRSSTKNSTQPGIALLAETLDPMSHMKPGKEMFVLRGTVHELEQIPDLIGIKHRHAMFLFIKGLGKWNVNIVQTI